MVQPYVRICAGFNKCNSSVYSDLMKFGWFMFVIEREAIIFTFFHGDCDGHYAIICTLEGIVCFV